MQVETFLCDRGCGLQSIFQKGAMSSTQSVSMVPKQQRTDLYMFRLIFESMVFMSMGSEMIS